MTRTTDDGMSVGGADSRARQIDRSALIRDLNDRTRTAMSFRFIYATVGVRALFDEATTAALAKVRSFDAFSSDNDPFGEHDFGSFELAGEKLFWKIDYYDRRLQAGSPDPADPAVTSRVLTIMLANEY